MSDLFSILEKVLESSPFVFYPLECCIITVIVFFIAHWYVGKIINQEIVVQLAIPTITSIQKMGFVQNPAFNTITTSPQPTYGVPDLANITTVDDEDEDEEDDNDNDNKKDSKDNSKQKTLASSSIPSELPSGSSLDIPATLYNNTDITIKKGDIWDYIWSRSLYSYQIYATGHPLFTGIRMEIATVGRHDPFLQLLSFVNLTPWKDTFVITLSLPKIDPFFYGVFLNEKDTIQAQDASMPWLEMFNARLTQDTQYTVLTDVEELLTGGGYTDYKFDKKKKNELFPSSNDIAKKHPILSILPFFTQLSTQSHGVFSFQSLHISDLSDGIQTIDVTGVPAVEYDTTQLDVQEDCCLIQCVIHFNQSAIPTSKYRDEDPTNQIFVNTWVNDIFRHLAFLGDAVAKFQFPTSILKRILLARQEAMKNPSENDADEDKNNNKTPSNHVVSPGAAAQLKKQKSHSKKFD